MALRIVIGPLFTPKSIKSSKVPLRLGGSLSMVIVPAMEVSRVSKSWFCQIQ